MSPLNNIWPAYGYFDVKTMLTVDVKTIFMGKFYFLPDECEKITAVESIGYKGYKVSSFY